MNNKKYVFWAAVVGVFAAASAAAPVFAQTNVGVAVNANVGVGGSGGGIGGHFGGGIHGPVRASNGVFGTVTAINGDTLTVSSQMRMAMGGASTTSVMAMTYTVNGSNATVVKDGASSTFSSIAVNDKVMVRGAVSGSNVAATMILDGMGGSMMPGGGRGGYGSHGSSTSMTSPIPGNGEPVIAGKITAISGATITVTNVSNVTYTIDASSAKIVEHGTTTAMSNVATGDNVVVQGVVNGNSVTASSIIDQGGGTHANDGGTATSATASGSATAHVGFLGAIGNFFKHLFGF